MHLGTLNLIERNASIFPNTEPETLRRGGIFRGDILMKTNRIKEFMVRDHDRLFRTLKDFRQTKDKDPARAWELLLEFKSGLLGHITWEEEILFPSIECRTDMHIPGPFIRTRTEHQQIRGFLEKLTDRIVQRGEEAEELGKNLINLLILHCEEEEKILFPWIEMTLNEADQEDALNKIGHSAVMKKDR